MRSIAGSLARFLAILALVISAVGLGAGRVVAQQTQIPPEEYAALVALYESTDGANWFSTKWTLPTDAPCELAGVECANGHVTELRLYSKNLSGLIPPELGDLANMRYLYLYENQLSGPIPPEIGNMVDLRRLNLGTNQLSGPIPPELGNLVKLDWYLDLAQNQLSGPIPPELGNLANLDWYLDLTENQLSGPIPPELGNLANLGALYLYENQLSGPIPPELGNLANLRGLNLRSNQLSGPLPPEIGNLANLRLLNLGTNQLSGPIPPEIGNLVNLRYLYLYENQLSGPLPPELGNLANLRHLHLSENQLSGAIPPILGDLANLVWLSLYESQLSGTIPPELGNLANLVYLQLYENQLSGALPRSLMSLSRLEWFEFHSTDLCEPADAEFQAWLASIPTLERTHVLCPAHWLVTKVGDELQIAYGSGVDLPQYSVLHLDSGFFRLNYGPAAGWGTSVILLPALWSDGVYHQGAPVDATWQVEGADLILTVTGTIASLDVSLTVRLYPPVRDLRILADVEATIEGSAPLDDRPGEAFKPVMLSSMRISPTEWDTQTACAAAQSYAIPEDSWIIWPHVVDQTFGLIGGTSEWKVNAPTVLIELDEPMTITGWVTPSEDPNDDNVGFWAASDSVLPSWSYKIYTSSVDECTDPPAGWHLFLPLVLAHSGSDR